MRASVSDRRYSEQKIKAVTGGFLAMMSGRPKTVFFGPPNQAKALIGTI